MVSWDYFWILLLSRLQGVIE